MTITPRYKYTKRIPFSLGCNCLSIAIIIIPILLLFGAIPFLESVPVGAFPAWVTPFILLPLFLPCLGIVALLFSAIPTYMQLRSKRAIDRLLQGEGLLANWQYDYNLEGLAEDGYVYVGEQGVFTQGDYRPFKYPGGRLLALEYEAGNPGKLNFGFGTARKEIGYVEVGAGHFSAYYDVMSIPVPQAHAADAQMIVERLTPKEKNE